MPPPESMQPRDVTLFALHLRHWKAILGGAILIVLGVLIGFALPFLTKDVIDALEQGTATKPYLLKVCGLYLLGATMAALCARGMRRLLIMLGYKISTRLRRLIFVQLSRLDRTFYLKEQTGDIMTRMTSDVRAITDMIGMGVLHTFRSVMTFVVGFTVMFSIDAQLATVVAVLLPLMTGVVFVIVFFVRKRYAASQEQFSLLSSFAQENFAGIRLVKGFGIEDRQNEAFGELNDEYMRRNLAQSRIECPSWPVVGALLTIGLVLIVYVGGLRVIAGEPGMTVGTIVQFMQYFFFVQWPMMALGWTMNLMVKGNISWKRIRHLLDAEPAIQDGSHAVERLGGDIEFRHVSLKFGELIALDDINLRIPEGKIVAVTGPTGCGKTLLASLLVRQYDPSEGQVFIGVEDIRDVPVQALRDHVRIALQEPFLFSVSLGDNIGYGLPAELGSATDPDNPSADAMQRVLHAAHTASFQQEAEDFPDGLRTELGERGVTLSGGQRQRASIARALTGNPNVLVLDDTLSAIDTQTEATIIKRLVPVLRQRTALIVSHRISSLRFADFIVVMERGRITQIGSHDDLVSQEGYYRELDIMQRLAAQLEEHGE